MARGGTFADYKQKLFAPERLLAHRMLFENLTLPSFAVQADAGFANRMALQIITSTHLPEQEKDQLSRILKPYPWTSITFVDEEEPLPYKALRDEYLSQKVNDVACYAHCRIDDDDGIAVGCLHEMEKYAKECYVGMVVSFCKGVYIYCDMKTGKVEFAHSAYKPKIALGLAHIGMYDRLNKRNCNALAYS